MDSQRVLEITYEQINQVKESKMSNLMHSDQLFSMKDNESMIKIFIRFTNIINRLQVLRKVLKELEKVIKILKFLLKKWKATNIHRISQSFLWSDSKDDSIEEENKNEMASMCLTVDELDKVNFNFNQCF